MEKIDAFAQYIKNQIYRMKCPKDTSDNFCESKENVNVTWINEVANIFLMNVEKYKQFLDNFIRKLRDTRCHDIVLQNELNNSSLEILRKCYEFEKRISITQQLKIRELFRNAFAKYFYQSKILKRFYEKPQGYPGDYLMFEILYQQKHISKGLGQYFDIFALKYPLAESVRYRKDKIKQFLSDFITKSNRRSLDILNFGCGSAREIKELLDENIFSKQIKFTFLDQDKDALNFARGNIAPLENIHLEFLEEGILNIVGVNGKYPNIQKGRQDFVYSIGMIDYFHDNTLENFLKYCLSLLKKDGQLIVACCSSHSPEDYLMLRWFCEWNFYVRNPSLTKFLIKKFLSVRSIEIRWEENHKIFFVIIIK